MDEGKVTIVGLDGVRKRITELNKKLADELAETHARMAEPAQEVFPTLTWYEKMFLVVFDFFSSIGFALGFIFAGLLIAPLGGIWEGVVRGIDAARALVVFDDDDEESE